MSRPVCSADSRSPGWRPEPRGDQDGPCRFHRSGGFRSRKAGSHRDRARSAAAHRSARRRRRQRGPGRTARRGPQPAPRAAAARHRGPQGCQEYRAPAMPESAALVERLRADGIPAVISGAGPTVLGAGRRGIRRQGRSSRRSGLGRQSAGPRRGGGVRSTARPGGRPLSARLPDLERGNVCWIRVVLTSSLHPTPPWRGASCPRPGQPFFREPPKLLCAMHWVLCG